ncbi:TonB-dependent receptor [Undibacterium sp. Jales W-56]|uniref:TonB-dependent receptor plug domain-containing protein n=1 Tax=Undibacterium sp. Jales W-56 TaxID=2897325 RepID=UPI0021CEB6DE|nr:TonB-dependent receptor [Undibacterium sp. Jales W-56]MCU6434964.1 TonB-dependent receptor [Undibacterium sp. Jales W-56]
MNLTDSCISRLPLLFLLAGMVSVFPSTQVWAQASDVAGATIDNLNKLSLEDLLKVQVRSASKYAQSTSHAPSAVQIISAEDIRRHGWRTLAEALDSLPGMYASSDRAYAFVGARGFMVPGDYNMRFLLLLDGQPLNDNLYDQANLGHEFRIDMRLIDRIEYVPGPGSSIYGANAMFGVINVLTRSARQMPGYSAGMQWQSHGWRELYATASRNADTDLPELILSVSRADQQGRDLQYPGAVGLLTANGRPSVDGMTHGLDVLAVTRLFVGLRQDNFAMSAWAARRDVHPSSALYGSNFDDGRLHLIDSSYGVTASYQKELASTLQLDARFAYQKITYQGDAPYTNPAVGSYVNRDTAKGSWLSGEARVMYTGLADHKWIAGLDFQSDLDAIQKNADLNVAVNPPLSISTPHKRYGVYLQDEWNFLPEWRLNAGIRADRNSYSQLRMSPRLALIWNASPDLTLKLLGGRAYRAANAYESAYARDQVYLANPTLAPETIRTLEAIAEYRIDSRQELGLSVFDYQLSNLISQIDLGGGLFQYQNHPSVRAQGLELFHRLRSRGDITVNSSVAFNRSRDATGMTLGNSPRWIAKLRGSRSLWTANWIAALEFNALGPRTLDWRGTRAPMGSQAVLNLTLNIVKVLPGLDLQLRVVNALDRRIVYPASNEAPTSTLPGDGRQWQLGLSYAF